ncbi:MAG TPA: glutamine-binding protein, partial [Acinetobacter nosocomialis]|nr:glutamine-binding protein [Acinetobacter nosocomialis]
SGTFAQNTESPTNPGRVTLTDGLGDAISQDSTYALAWAAKNPSYVAGIQSIGDQEFIAPAVKKGNTQLLNWLNTEIKQLRTSGEIKKIYDETLKPIYGDSVNPNVFLDVGQ